MARRILIAGNWKMNKTSVEGAALAEEIKATLTCGGVVSCSEGPEVLVCPPFLTLSAVAAAVAGSCVKLGAQNVHWAADGAFTGETSVPMLKAAGCTHVIIGHSERRQYFGETDATVNARAKAAVAEGLVAIICVGETLEAREQGTTNAVVDRQTRGGLSGITAADMDKVVIAYEPVWAIGTGKVATDEQAQDVHAYIRTILSEMYGEATAQSVRILYGGSMKPSNAAGLLAQTDIDGGLIGGAALQAEDFVGIVKAATV